LSGLDYDPILFTKCYFFFLVWYEDVEDFVYFEKVDDGKRSEESEEEVNGWIDSEELTDG